MNLQPRAGVCLSARSGDEYAATPATPQGTLPGMILTEHGLHFRRDGDRWRCVEWPGLRLTRDGTYRVDGHAQVLASLADAVRHLTEPAVSHDIS